MFVDIGANIGSYTILAASVVGSQSISIEPAKSTFKHLQRNVAINDAADKVEAHQCAIGRDSGVVKFSTEHDTTNRVADEDFLGKVDEVRLQSLDTLLHGRQTLLWKIDVEGYEEEVIAGADATLRNQPPLAILSELASPFLLRTLTEHGFQRATYDPFKKRLELLKEAGGAGGSSTPNQLWIRDFDTVARRCSTSRLFTVNGVSF